MTSRPPLASIIAVTVAVAVAAAVADAAAALAAVAVAAAAATAAARVVWAGALPQAYSSVGFSWVKAGGCRGDVEVTASRANSPPHC